MLEVDRAVVGDLEHFEGAAEAHEHRAAEGEVEDLVVGELRAQTREQLVVDGAVVGGEAFGVLDREPLPVGVARPRPPLVEMLVDVLGDAGLDDRRRPERRASASPNRSSWS